MEEQISLSQKIKEAIGAKAFQVFLWSIDKTAEEYFSEIHRQKERARKSQKRKQQRNNKQQKNQTS